MSGWDNSDSAPQSNVDWSEGNVSNNSYSNDRQSEPNRRMNQGPPRMDRGPPRGPPRYNGGSGGGGGYGGNDYESGGRPPPSNYKWASSKKRYEWKPSSDDVNAIAPRDEDLEKELFGEDSHVHTGLNFDKYDSIPSSVRGDNPPSPVDKFEQCDLHPAMKENIRLARYTTPTPVQRHSISIVTAGRDLMACAQTGSGKTAAFLIPSLSALFGKAHELSHPRPMNSFAARQYRAEPLVLILAPTRELCTQIFDECRRFSYRSQLRPCAIYGGAESFPQKLELEKGCDILAATPGRLQDFIQRGKVGLKRIKYLVLDEADRMLDMGFESSIRDIVEQSGMNPDRQTLMYSATFPRTIRKLARDFLKPDYLFLKVGRVGGTTTNITQKVHWVEEEEKRERIKKLLLSQPPSRTLIFVETKRGADSLDQYLYDQSFPTTSIHGDRTQMEREDALIAFKNGKCPILVATAVAARGLDVRNVMHVVNYDMTNDLDEYIHRIGRTARVGNSGLATTFFNDRNLPIATELTKVLQENKQEIPDFLKDYMATDLTFAEDMDEDNVELPSYAKHGLRRGGGFGGPANNDGPNWFDHNNNDNSQGYNNNRNQGYDRNNNSQGGGYNDGGYDSRPSYGGGADSGYGTPRQGPPGGGRDGDWTCPTCNGNNFSRRTECFKCNASRPEGAGGGGGYGGDSGKTYGGERRRPGPTPGDWECPSCGVSNFARRTECFKCNAPKEGQSGNNGSGGYNNQPAGDGSWGGDNSAPSWDTSANNAPVDQGNGWGAPKTEPSNGNWDSSTVGEWGASPTPAGNGSWGATPPNNADTKPAQQDSWGTSSPAAESKPAQQESWGAPAESKPAQQESWGASVESKPAQKESWGAPAESKPAQQESWGASNTNAAGNASPSIPNGADKKPAQQESWGSNDVQEVAKGVQNMKVQSPSGNDGWGDTANTSGSAGWDPNHTPW
ncbi:hypothetical protein BC943DRAFT_376566 [Umbelopsis sp. AD052]|nr:hypothetical protein BC943DRAFT_376566 [Umbelopsis sp. AD052]